MAKGDATKTLTARTPFSDEIKRSCLELDVGFCAPALTLLPEKLGKLTDAQSADHHS